MSGIRCPICRTNKWDYTFRSPIDPAEDKFKCANGHPFKRYEEVYLLCNRSAGFLGNSPVFWRKGGSGYTQWIDEAEHWTEVEADRQIRSCMGSHHFEKIPLSLVERLAKRTLDQQDLNREMDKETTESHANLPSE